MAIRPERLCRPQASGPKDIELARKGLDKAWEIVRGGEHDLLILDEINVVADFGLVPVLELLDLARSRRGDGPDRDRTERAGALVDLADTVSEVREISTTTRRGSSRAPGWSIDGAGRRGGLEPCRGNSARRRAAAARGMSLVENGAPEAEALLESVYGKKAPAPRIGITGPPGAGKSTLVAEYARLLRGEGLQVGVVAVDPTSPFTGGAILGDRVRMGEHATDAKVFIRSMATRGSLGGLAARTGDLCEILDGWGSQITLVERSGSGSRSWTWPRRRYGRRGAHARVGDAIQALKAGLMEIADVIVLNKADHLGADAMEAALRSSLAFRKEGGWRPPIVRTVAIERKGLEELHKALLEHRAYAGRPEVSSALRREKTRMRLRNALREELLTGGSRAGGSTPSWIAPRSAC